MLLWGKDGGWGGDDGEEFGKETLNDKWKRYMTEIEPGMIFSYTALSMLC